MLVVLKRFIRFVQLLICCVEFYVLCFMNVITIVVPMVVSAYISHLMPVYADNELAATGSTFAWVRTIRTRMSRSKYDVIVASATTLGAGRATCCMIVIATTTGRDVSYR